MEYWVGWFDTWGGEHMVKDANGKCFSVLQPSRYGPGLWVLHTFLGWLLSSFNHDY